MITKRERVVLSAYTGILMCKSFSEVHEYAEEVMGRPIFTHEFARKEVAAELKEKSFRPSSWRF